MKSAAALVVALAVCGPAFGGSALLVPTRDVLAVVRGAGFSGIAIRSYGQDGDWIYTRGQPLLQGTLSDSDRATLPPGFRRDALAEVRVCNVVLTSYNAHPDPGLQVRARARRPQEEVLNPNLLGVSSETLAHASALALELHGA